MPRTKLYTSASESCHLTAPRDASDGKSKVRDAGEIENLTEALGWSGLIQLGVSQGEKRETLEDANEYRML